MAIIFQPYTILLLSTVIISAALAIAVLKNRPTLGTHSFAVLMGAVCMWAFLIIFEVISQDLPTKNFSGSFKYLFIVTVPPAWFIFALYYSNRLQQLSLKYMTLLAIIPVVTLLMTMTNGYHHLMFKSIEWHHSNGLILPLRHYGPWFWVHTTYSYGLIFLGFLFLAKSIIESQRIFRRQAISLLVAALAPWMCNMFFLIGARPSPYLDLTPFAFMISGLAVMWGIMRYRLLDIVPIARDVVIQNMIDGIVVMDNHCRILDVNSAGTDLLGKQQIDLIGRDADQVISWWPKRSIADGLNSKALPALVKTDHKGCLRNLQISASILQNKGKSSGHLVILRDITEMKRTQDSLRQSEERFKSLSENAPVIVLALDEAGMIRYVNPAWTAILGHDRAELIGKPFSRFVLEDPNRPYNEVIDRLINGKQVVAESNVRFLHKRGGQKIFDLTAAVNSNAEGRITGIICLAKDITEEGRLREQLFQSQKMEAIGTLAGGIAHDFNNLLMGMQANISLMRLETETAFPLQEKLKRIEDQIQSGASLTRQLLGYARKGKYVLAAIDIHHLIKEALHIVQRANKNVIVQCDLNAAPAFVEADKGQMELVFLNLFVNAVDAMPNGGKLTVATRHVGNSDLTSYWPDLKPGFYVEISITDTGVGMDQRTMDRIFEPFFTTKEIGRGTGLGLASVYGVVKNHNGDIQVTSSIGQGTTFVLIFPAVVAPADKIVSPLSEIVAYPRGRQILLVDDEAPILDYIGEMIQTLGFEVLSAGNGQEAARIYETNHQNIDIVILDMIMPEMGGREVFQLLKAINPQVKVIIASGYGLCAQSEDILGQGPHEMLTKPFTREELAKAIGKILGPCESAEGVVKANDPSMN